MSELENCNRCREADPVLVEYIDSISEDMSYQRMKQQETKCGYGLQGVCCRLCSNGPCRISKARPKGVCGADADTIVARNFLRNIAAGTSCYIHVVENTANNLRQLALEKGEIKGRKTLEYLCEELDITGSDVHEKALKIAEAVLEDLRRPDDEKMVLTRKLAYSKRFEKWSELGILPGGAKAEVFRAIVKTSTNLNSDPVDMLLNTLKLGIATGLYGLTMTNLLNDIISGQAQLTWEPVGFRVMKPDYINIMLTGHEMSYFEDLQYKVLSEDATKRAKSLGAKGIRLLGCTCVGQDFQLRKAACSEAFCGHAGNNYASEAVLMTGCVDLVVSEFNCTLPGIEPICDKLDIAQICLNDVVKKKNAEMMPFTFEQRAKISDEIINHALNSYEKRRKLHFKDGRINPMAHHGNDATLTGVTEQTLKAFLGGTWKPLIDLLVSKDIKGVVGVVGCSNLRAMGHDVHTVELVKELIAKDILVLSSGCSCGGIENIGLMTKEAAKLAGPKLRAVCEKLGIPPVLNFGPCLAIGRIEIIVKELASALNVDLPQLPVALSAPQWLEEQALADGVFGLALGIPLHLGLAPFVTGSDLAVDIVTNQMKTLTGGQLIIEEDPKKAAEVIESLIEEKRAGLNI